MICRSKVNRGNYFKYQDIYLKTLKSLVNMRRVSIYFLILFSCLFVCFCSVSVFLRILYKGKHLLNKCITRYTIATTIWHWLKISNTFRGNLFNENLETIPRRISYYNHFVTSVQIRSFFWSLFPSIRTEYVFCQNMWKYGPEKKYVFGQVSSNKFLTNTPLYFNTFQ